MVHRPSRACQPYATPSETVARAAAAAFPPARASLHRSNGGSQRVDSRAIQQQGSALITLDAYDTLFLKNVFAASASDFIVHA